MMQNNVDVNVVNDKHRLPRRRSHRNITTSLDAGILKHSSSTRYKKDRKRYNSIKISDLNVVMSPLSFEDIDLLNTPLSSLRSCSEYNEISQKLNAIAESNRSLNQPMTNQSNWFNFKLPELPKSFKFFTPKKKRVRIMDIDADEKSYFVDAFRSNSAISDKNTSPSTTMIDENDEDCFNPSLLGCSDTNHYDRYNTDGTKLSSSSLSQSERSISNSTLRFSQCERHTPEKSKIQSSFGGFFQNIFTESSYLIDMFLGLNIKSFTDSKRTFKNEKSAMPMEIELCNFKEPEFIYSCTQSSYANLILHRADVHHEDENFPNMELPTLRREDSSMSLRRIASMGRLNRLNETDEISKSVPVVALIQQPSPVVNITPTSSESKYKMILYQFVRSISTEMKRKAVTILRDRNDDYLYEMIRIQPFSCGAYFRALLVNGFFNLFFNSYNLLCWPLIVNTAISSAGVDQALNGIVETSSQSLINILFLLQICVTIQVLFNVLQMPVRLYIHWKCWESSQALELEQALSTTRSMLDSDVWLTNRLFGRIIDFLSICILIICEICLWTHEIDANEVGIFSIIVSLISTSLLTIIARLIICILFAISMHDPNVLSDARKRGLSGRDLQCLPTFVFTRLDEVNNNDCSICLSAFEMGEMLIPLPCDKKHSFHAHCIRTWLQRQNSCPLCQKMV